jgi:hypothetical protein
VKSSERNAKYYAKGFVGGKRVYLARLILGVTDPRVLVDHRDGNPMNCRRDNLRVCSHSQNVFNSGSRGGTSVYKGVHFDKYHQRWIGRIAAHGVKRRLGMFNSEEEAARAYDAAALELHGEFARLNFPAT